ncbi:MAG TPA: flavocytochrome c [Paraburkholderia sp.]|uniref:FAD-dependent oxidoreductase n=1 Tax=Paraburkholderia sp. TaxID=1926495 RepID=UPI002B45D8C8|nr:flavocytochrome c [Paraburkholderia sp.]HKR42885.1 flavocytochrome c [Paraburkholderia sp.]
MTTPDLLVIGGGMAGFCAALEAANARLTVTLLEKQPETGGSSAMSGGCLAFAGTDLQREHGVEDSGALLFSDLREVGNFDNSEALVRAYVDHQLDTYHWMREHGVAFGHSIETSSGQSVPRVHSVDPADAVRQLARACAATGRVSVKTNAAAHRLVRADDGRFTGVRASVDGDNVTLYAKRGVILASGGFCRNAEMVHRYAPQYDEAVFIGGDGNVGDGLKMALEFGADLRDMAYIKGTYGKHPLDETNHHSCLAVYKGAIAVNQDGKRFVDESVSYKLLGDAAIRQPYGATFQILDQRIMDSGDDRVRILDFQRRHEEGLFIEANSLAELARLIEVPEAALLDTVERYNAAVDSGHDEAFGRAHLVHRHGELCRIEQAPFYAYPSTAAVFGTYCGLRVDAQMRVLNVFDEALDGLYAAGEIVGGFHGGAYMTGTALGKAAIFGRLAARSASGAER